MAVLEARLDAYGDVERIVAEPADPGLLAIRSTSLGSFCRRWELIITLVTEQPDSLKGSRWAAVGQGPKN